LIVYNPIIVNDAAVFAFFTGEYSDKALFFWFFLLLSFGNFNLPVFF
jgi:hypothetical protein